MGERGVLLLLLREDELVLDLMGVGEMEKQGWGGEDPPRGFVLLATELGD